ncbi:hypothetical protein GCM10008025_20160 [Ornithinibacillus halotolerans]|uniref:Uncharacterized protein n=1 Tax=Ornithinibacillus halotolerans TaxID=1274357 RepID=A0A916S0D5_9BACI|nr:hypothetical protein GCM10008025_20160 [Ornithinibacillus halotolerans]
MRKHEEAHQPPTESGVYFRGGLEALTLMFGFNLGEKICPNLNKVNIITKLLLSVLINLTIYLANVVFILS